MFSNIKQALIGTPKEEEAGPKITLYPHQVDALEAMRDADKGQLILPTGTGKTAVQGSFIAGKIAAAKEKGEAPGIHMVVAPRLLLSYQLATEVTQLVVQTPGVDPQLYFFHSGNDSFDREAKQIMDHAGVFGNSVQYRKSQTGTNGKELGRWMKKYEKRDQPLLIFTTYESWHRASKQAQDLGLTFETVMFDESQFLVQESQTVDQQTHQVEHLTAKQWFCFTATPRVSEDADGIGHNNFDIYGRKLYELRPKDAISLGLIVQPRLHIISLLDTDAETEEVLASRNIAAAFRAHRETLAENCELGAKLLITVKGVDTMYEFLKSPEYRALREEGVNIFAVSSRTDVRPQKNKVELGKGAFLRKLRETANNESAEMIALHYDMIAEGLDASGFTAVYPLRELSDGKFLQTYGRASRLHPDDRAAFREGTLDPQDEDTVNHLKKPFAYVILPEFTLDHREDSERHRRVVEDLLRIGLDLEDTVTRTETEGGNTETTEIEGGMKQHQKKMSEEDEVPLDLSSNVETIEAANMYGRLSDAAMIDYLRRMREAPGPLQEFWI